MHLYTQTCIRTAILWMLATTVCTTAHANVVELPRSEPLKEQVSVVLPELREAVAVYEGGSAILFEQKSRGASYVTARADRLRGGVAASVKMAQMDERRVLVHREKFEVVARRHGVPAALLAAIASRETRGGRHLRPSGYSVFGGNRGYGIMQVDGRFHRPQGAPASLQHIAQAAEILVRFRGQLARSHSAWTKSQVLKAAVAAYNCGPGRVRSLASMDRYTTGRDYSDDIWARAQYFAKRLAAKPS